MMTIAPLAVDTCILAEATDTARAQHAAALAVLELHPNLVLPAQVVREYLVAATRPASVNGLGLPLDQARANLDAFLGNIQLLPEERPILPAFWGLLDVTPCVGKRLHDAHIAATAVAHGVAEILTLNGPHFQIFSAQVSVVTPPEVIERLEAG